MHTFSVAAAAGATLPGGAQASHWGGGSLVGEHRLWGHVALVAVALGL